MSHLIAEIPFSFQFNFSKVTKHGKKRLRSFQLIHPCDFMECREEWKEYPPPVVKHFSRSLGKECWITRNWITYGRFCTRSCLEYIRSPHWDKRENYFRVTLIPWPPTIFRVAWLEFEPAVQNCDWNSLRWGWCWIKKKKKWTIWKFVSDVWQVIFYKYKLRCKFEKF